MSTKQSTVDFLVEQMAGAGSVSARKMFGEYAIYRGAKLVALVCDDELFVKPSPAGAALLGEVDARAPYPGAKPYLWISGDGWDDRERLSELIRVTAAALPAPSAKKPKSSSPAKARASAKTPRRKALPIR